MIGTVIGNYKITEKIGEGGMGAVFRGLDEMLEREVAIKMLRPELARQPDVVERFRTEAVTLAKLNHPNIATLFSFLRQNDDYFMVMEFVRGNTLESILRNFGAIPYERAILLFCQALEGIDHAHKQGIIHRDIKPANVMVLETGAVKVMDFGIARVLGTARMTRQGNVVGTVEYMSPEQIRGDETDTRADIYSLGILLYEMLTGRVPFESPSEYELMKQQVECAPPPPTQYAAHIPVLIEQAIMRALAKKPDARFRTAGEFRSVLLGTMKTITGQLPNTTGNYAAPATRIDQGIAQRGSMISGIIGTSAPVSERQSGETRVDVPPQHTVPFNSPTPLSGTQQFASPSNSREVTAPPVQPKTTDEKGTEKFSGGPMTYGTQVIQPQSPATYPLSQSATQPGVEQGAKPQALESSSVFSKLGARHYAVAAVILLALMSVPAALLLRKGDPPPSPTVESQEQPATEEQPSADPTANPVQVEDPNSNTAVVDETGNINSNTADSKAARARRNEKNENTSAVAGETPPAETTQTTPQQTPAQTTEPQTTPPQETKQATANEPAKPAEVKKEEKKKGIGGFFKKIFGSDKKEDKKKDAKKPNN